MLESNISKAVFAGNGMSTEFPFAFKVWDAAHLRVVLTNTQGVDAEATDWAVSFTEQGGTVTYSHEGSPLPTGWKLTILRNMPFTQGVDLVSGTSFDPKVIDTALDQATAERQQLREAVQRAIQIGRAHV